MIRRNLMGAVKRAISSIFSWDFSRIGYTSENTPLLQQFEDAIAYSEEKARTFTPSNARVHFKMDKRLMFVPMVDTSGVTNMSDMFYSCSSLISIPQLDTSNVTNMDSMFSATALTAIPQLDTSNVTNMSNMFKSCITLISIPQLDTSNVTQMGDMFYYCPNLTTISQLDMGKVTKMGDMFYSCSKLVFALIKNIGKSSLTTYNFSGASVWGTGGEENRQSLIDSLITYSYDRASNGMDTATIKLSSKTKALLTEEEIAQIEAKGFTIA